MYEWAISYASHLHWVGITFEKLFPISLVTTDVKHFFNMTLVLSFELHTHALC